MKSFWFHYNKPASRKAKRNILTVHWQGQCILVHGIRCLKPIQSKDRKTQPFCVMAGKANNVLIEDNIAVIY